MSMAMIRKEAASSALKSQVSAPCTTGGTLLRFVSPIGPYEVAGSVFETQKFSNSDLGARSLEQSGDRLKKSQQISNASTIHQERRCSDPPLAF